MVSIEKRQRREAEVTFSPAPTDQFLSPVPASTSLLTHSISRFQKKQEYPKKYPTKLDKKYPPAPLSFKTHSGFYQGINKKKTKSTLKST